MTAEEKIEKIKKLLEEMDFTVATKEAFEKEFYNETIGELKEDIWDFYTFMCKVDAIIRELIYREL